MTTTKKIQLRGNCQCCGRLQAATNGYIAQHGYTVKNGWFQGVCGGHLYAPMQHDRTQTDKIIASVREQCAELRDKAAKLEAGTITPASVMKQKRDINTGKLEQVTIPYADAEPWEQRDAVRMAIYNAENRARAGESFASDMDALAARVHGTALVEVPVEAGPAPISIGEARKLPNGKTAKATRVHGARVYWKNETGFNGWTGSAAWRRFELAE